MRKVLLLLATCLVTTKFAFAQSQQQNNDAALKLVKKYFNRQQTDSLYAMTGKAFQASISKSAFVNIASKQLYPLGAIGDTRLLKYNDGVSSYKAELTNATLELLLSLDSAGKLSAFAFRPYKDPVADKKSPVPTSNPMSSAQDKKIDTIARSYIQKANTVGLSVGILKDGMVTTYDYGETAKNKNNIPTEHTLFEIGSITKTFTATLLAYYVVENKIKLSDPVTKYLPDSVSTNKELQSITLAMLSNHTSGIPSIPDNFFPNATDKANPYKDYSRAMLFSYLRRCKPESPAGTKYAYSNAGAALLGVILERVGSQSYGQMVRQIICAPLGMNNTVQHLSPAQLKNFVSVYDEEGEATPAWDFDAMAPAGALRSSVHDLLLYARGNLGQGTNTLSRAFDLTHQITWSGDDQKVGLGWHQNTHNGFTYYWHNGGTYGSRSFIGFIPGRNTAVVVLSNCGTSVDDIALEMLNTIEKH